FFFQAEDGIRDDLVTGVQTCALPISYHYNCPMDRRFFAASGLEPAALRDFIYTGADDVEVTSWMRARAKAPPEQIAAWSRRFRRSEERRVGEEGGVRV